MQCSFFPFFNHSEQNVPNLRRQTSCLLTVCGAAICMRNGLRPIRGDVFLTSPMQRPSFFFLSRPYFFRTTLRSHESLHTWI